MGRTKGASRRLTPASRPKTARQREATTKRRGELAELAFVYKAASLGFGVAKPYGDSERYDFRLEAVAHPGEVNQHLAEWHVPREFSPSYQWRGRPLPPPRGG